MQSFLGWYGRLSYFPLLFESMKNYLIYVTGISSRADNLEMIQKRNVYLVSADDLLTNQVFSFFYWRPLGSSIR